MSHSNGAASLAKRLRRLRMGAATLSGVARQGFFIPYRYAAGVEEPQAYDALAPFFEAATPAMHVLLSEAEGLAATLERFSGAQPPQPRWEQSWFPRLDGVAAYTLVRQTPPKRILEVGSGHSTRFLAQAAHDAGAPTAHECIDPAPRASLTALKVDWRAELLSPSHAALFSELEAGDMAVFDSSHILMPGTDVDMILNRLLPVLKPGVRVHIHDVFLPDPYPAGWSWRGYNEQNALGPLLASPGWRVVFSSWFAATRMDLAQICPRVAQLPMAEGAVETSLWLERV